MGLKFKTIFEESKKKKRVPNSSTFSSDLSQESSTPNLNKPLFIEQTQEELFEEAAVN